MTIDHNSSTRKKNRLFKVLLILFSIYVILFSLVWGISSYVISSQVNKLISPYNLRLSEESRIRFNPFIVSLSLQDLTVFDDQEKSVLKLGRVVVDLNVLALIQKQVAFDQLIITDVNAVATKNVDEISIAGIPLPKPKTDEAGERAGTQDKSGWSVNLSNPEIKNVSIDFLEGEIHHPILLNDADLSELVLEDLSQQFKLSANYKYHNAELALSLAMGLNDGLGKAEYSLALKNLDLSVANEYSKEQIGQIKGSLDTFIKGEINFDKSGINLGAEALEILITDVVLIQEDIGFSLERLDLKSNSVDVSFEDEEVSTDLTLAMSVESANLVQTNTENVIARVAKLGMPNIQLTQRNDSFTILNDEVVLNEIVISDKSNSNTSDMSDVKLVSLNQLLLNDVQLTPELLSMEQVYLDALAVQLIIDKEKQITNLVVLDKGNHSVDSAEFEKVLSEQDNANVAANAEDSLNFKVGKVEISTGSKIKVHDESVSPTFEQTIVINKAMLSNVDSLEKSSLAALLLDANIGKHANVNINTEMQPFSPKLNMKTQMKLTEFSLPKISSYLGQSLGLEFLSGQLDSDISLVAENDILDGDALIKLRGLELAGTSHEKGDVVQETGMIPLNVALNMLKDSDDNVELNIPLSGDVNDPSFGIQSFIGLVAKKAILSATESYLMQTFVPYSNIVSVARIAGEYMLRVTIDDLEYAPKQIEVSENQLSFIEDLVALLAEYPDKQLKVCAISVPADIELTSEISDEQKAKLVKLSNQRGEVFKDALVDKYNVNSGRLLLCKPKIDMKSKALPRVEFTL